MTVALILAYILDEKCSSNFTEFVAKSTRNDHYGVELLGILVIKIICDSGNRLGNGEVGKVPQTRVGHRYQYSAVGVE